MNFSSSLASDLREKYKRRSIRPRVGDSVRIIRGEYKGIEGKISKIDSESRKLNVEGVTREKIKGGPAAPVPVDASKVVVTALNLDDKQRKAGLGE